MVSITNTQPTASVQRWLLACDPVPPANGGTQKLPMGAPSGAVLCCRHRLCQLSSCVFQHMGLLRRCWRQWCGAACVC